MKERENEPTISASHQFTLQQSNLAHNFITNRLCISRTRVFTSLSQDNLRWNSGQLTSASRPDGFELLMGISPIGGASFPLLLF